MGIRDSKKLKNGCPSPPRMTHTRAHWKWWQATIWTIIPEMFCSQRVSRVGGRGSMQLYWLHLSRSDLTCGLLKGQGALSNVARSPAAFTLSSENRMEQKGSRKAEIPASLALSFLVSPNNNPVWWNQRCAHGEGEDFPFSSSLISFYLLHSHS